MASLGNPLSFGLGGGPSPQEQAYDTSYQSVGDGIQAEPGSLVEEWRMARARGLAAFDMDDRAAAQAFPDLSTDFLPVWEEILRVYAPPGSSDEERRQVITEAYTRYISAAYDAIDTSLKEVNELIEVLILPYEYTRTTVTGRAFEDWDPADPKATGPAFDANSVAGDNATFYSNFSDDFIVSVLFDVGSSILTPTNQRALQEVYKRLNEILPAWVDFRIFSACGFILDDDILDETAFCDGIV